MSIRKEAQGGVSGTKFIAEENGEVIGRAFLYILKNDLHKEPFGLMEDVFVEEAHRSRGTGGELVKAVIAEAKAQGCYKLVATSRHENPKAHAFYQRFGFKDQGKEFRMNF